MLTGATMYALAIGAVSHIITTVVARHSQSRKIERHAEAFIRMHSLPQHLASEVCSCACVHVYIFLNLVTSQL